jgi:hypothetical protein
MVEGASYAHPKRRVAAGLALTVAFDGLRSPEGNLLRQGLGAGILSGSMPSVGRESHSIRAGCQLPTRFRAYRRRLGSNRSAPASWPAPPSVYSTVQIRRCGKALDLPPEKPRNLHYDWYRKRGQVTFTVDINQWGVITGWYWDANHNAHVSFRVRRNPWYAPEAFYTADQFEASPTSRQVGEAGSVALQPSHNRTSGESGSCTSTNRA